MAPVVHLRQKVERIVSILHERKRSLLFKRTTRCDKNKSKYGKSNTKEHHRKNGDFNHLIVDDFVIKYKLPSDAKANSQNVRSVPKRKLSTDDCEEDWEPNSRRIKHQNDVSLYVGDDYLSDQFDASQIVPDIWEDGSEESICRSLSCDDDTDLLSPKATDYRILTIDEVIEFDSPKSPCERATDIFFDIEEDLASGKQKNALDVLLSFCTSSQLIIHENGLKEDNQIESCQSLFKTDDSVEVEDLQDPWENESPIDEFKFARCFKCRRKVYVMKDCPRHGTKGVSIQ